MVEHFLPTRSLTNVNRLKTVMTLLLAAFWLPVSSHVLLQHIGFIHEIHAHADHDDADQDGDSDGPHEHSANNHDAADGLCLTPAGKVQVPMPAFVVVPDWHMAFLVASLMDAGFASLHSGLSPPGVAPSELSRQWQFSSRAVLPVRAPSLIS